MTTGVGAVPPRVQPRVAERPVHGAGRGWVVTAGALLAVLLVDVVRVWLPSLLHLAGGPSLPRWTLQLAFLALAPVLLPLPATLALRRVPPAPMFATAVGGLAATRVVLQLAGTGGQLQLWVSSLGVALAVAALAVLAAGAPSGHLARIGILLGLTVMVALHATLGTFDLVWRDGPVAAVLVVAVAVVAVLAAQRARTVALWWPTPLGRDGELASVWTRGPAWPWLAFGPILALVGTLVAVPARLDLAVGLGPTGAAVASILAGGAAIGAALLARRAGGPVAGAIGATGTLFGTLLALRPDGMAAVGGQLGILVACGATVGALGRTPGDSGPRRRAAAAVTSMLLVWALTAAHLGAALVADGPPVRAWLVLAAIGVAMLAGAAAWTSRGLRPDRRPLRRPLAATALGTLLAAAVAAGVAPGSTPTPAPPADPDQLRVATYNLSSGFGADGRFDPDAIAEALRASRADVVVLNEVDRGWLVAGGHDLLRLLTRRLDLPHTAFAPAGADVWGNAVLSRYPLDDVRTERLPRAPTGMTRSWLSATLALGDQGSLAIVATQFHPTPEDATVRLAQARTLAAETTRLRGREVPVAVLGDLGAPPEAPELEPLGFLLDAVPSVGPTSPADAPDRRHDQILTTPDLRPSDPRVVATRGSRSRPLVVTLEPALVP